MNVCKNYKGAGLAQGMEHANLHDENMLEPEPEDNENRPTSGKAKKRIADATRSHPHAKIQSQHELHKQDKYVLVCQDTWKSKTCRRNHRLEANEAARRFCTTL